MPINFQKPMRRVRTVECQSPGFCYVLPHFLSRAHHLDVRISITAASLRVNSVTQLKMRVTRCVILLGENGGAGGRDLGIIVLAETSVEDCIQLSPVVVFRSPKYVFQQTLPQQAPIQWLVW